MGERPASSWERSGGVAGSGSGKPWRLVALGCVGQAFPCEWSGLGAWRAVESGHVWASTGGARGWFGRGPGCWSGLVKWGHLAWALTQDTTDQARTDWAEGADETGTVQFSGAADLLPPAPAVLLD